MLMRGGMLMEEPLARKWDAMNDELSRVSETIRQHLGGFNDTSDVGFRGFSILVKGTEYQISVSRSMYLQD